MNRSLIIAALIASLAWPALAEQKLSTRPNGSVRISASAGDVTRISVAGDRIRRIIKDESQFQEMNDEATGDIFLRYAGDQSKLAPESGYIITERGVTISYELTPKSNLGAETVIITVNGLPDLPAGTTSGSAGASGQRSAAGFELAAGEGGGGYASSLVAFTRATIDKHVAGRAAPSRGHGTVVASETGSGMRARVIVAAGGESGRYVRPQDFFNSKVLAVWVERNDLAPNTRAWVVVVEKR
ncbi:hypothetical protein HOY34_07405 [Xinfangfangia sp. D13-10-4-6]|uniref:TraK domain-containing protein n=1 Tax=Pseudogemmobacter hezensis TaxID=2737662 RepID=UPI001557F8DC|nr:type-F conjugative transfer system secretin TraK [Pseudogemmobacter hezensis]NPD15030.1 hypothetical protein [Pseudogemmobacter hezensis]